MRLLNESTEAKPKALSFLFGESLALEPDWEKERFGETMDELPVLVSTDSDER